MTIKLYYAYNGQEVTSSVQEDFDKLDNWKLIHPNYILQEDVGRNNSALKQVNGVILIKTADELRDELIPSADTLRNQITETEITAGFEWPPIDGVVFKMTAENQRNFTNLDRMANKGLLTYPYTIWCGEESVELANAQAVEDFYLMGVSFITQKLNEGKTVRASFRTMTLEQLKQWMKDNS
jgi:hypothetical protein